MALAIGAASDAWVENLGRLTVAVREGQFAGYVLWAPEYSYAELCTHHIRPDFRQLGVGKALLEAHLRDAARQPY